MADEGDAAGDEKKLMRSNIHRYFPSSSVARVACLALTAFLLLAGLIALVLYLVYRPSKPRFSVGGVAIHDLNVTSPAAASISSSMQLTLVSRNPSHRSSVLLDHLSVYVSYRSQAITPPAPVSKVYVDTQSEVAVSPLLGGEAVPVSAEVASALAMDEEYGVLGLRVVVMGRVKYRSGVFKSPWYGVYVTCDVLVGLKKGPYGRVPLLDAPDCHVDA